ncbi:MAG TPA: ATP-binding cassette domain-containing protein, partial [Agromyces sp.]|nr:ATP-binding cassette domain-containing protein [Agromyces sp.]
MTDHPALELEHVSLRIGGAQLLHDISLAVPEGEMLGVIGPNGAGKTTLFNCITGFYAPTAGSVRYRGRDISRLPVHKRTA